MLKFFQQKISTIYAVFLIVIVVALACYLSASNKLERLELLAYDSLLFVQNNQMSEQIVIIAIDDASINRIGRWPWSRKTHAELIDKLTPMQPQAIGIDMLFSEQQTDDNSADSLLAQAMETNSKVILPVAPTQLTPRDPVTELLPIIDLAVAAHSMGHVDVELDIDGINRRFFLYAGLGDARWSALALAMIEASQKKINIPDREGSLANTSSTWLRQNEMLIPFVAPSIHPKIISYVDVLEGRIEKSEINNKFVLIGSTASGLGDFISTPVSSSHERMPGVELIANVLNGLLQNIHIYTLSKQQQMLINTLFIILTAIAVIFSPLRYGWFVVGTSLITITLFSIFLLSIKGLWYPPAVALLSSFLIWPLWSGWELIIENRLRQRLLQQLENQALHHIATGLPNQYMLENKLSSLKEEPQLNSNNTALMVLHVNWPGASSIVLGRPLTDKVLNLIRDHLHTAIDGDKFIAHLNDDNFAILLTNLNSQQSINEIASNLLDSLEQPLEEEQNILLMPQIGVSTLSANEDASALLRNAYVAMFKSRLDDSERLYIYSANIGQQLEDRSQLEQALIHALERDEFEVYYQPQINAKTGKIIGVEALIRWNNPVLGWVGPDTFIPIAEHVGLIKNIGHWVLETACKQLSEWNKKGLGPIRLAVNLSPIQFSDPNLMTKINNIIVETCINPHQLELEITESSVIGDLQHAINTMRAIKKAGIELAIDDFGTGYSSLSNLRHFPIDRLKVDQAFTRELGESQDTTEITLTIMAMAKQLKLNIIAEGVETIEQANFLRQHGCDEFQGYLFSKPVSAENLTKLLIDGIDVGYTAN